MSPYRTTLYLLFLFSLVSASGYLRLEFTASTNCHIRLTTDFSDETLLLHMGEKRITSFHPQTVRPDRIRVGLSVGTGKMRHFEFALKNTGQQLRHLFEDSELVVLIQSVYECNPGFNGLTCEFRGTPTTVTTTTVTETQTPTTPHPLIVETPENFNRLIIAILLVIIISLAMLIIVFGILLFSTDTQQQHIIFADSTQTKIPAHKKKREGDCIYEEIKEVRYTTAPFQMVEMGNWI